MTNLSISFTRTRIDPNKPKRTHRSSFQLNPFIDPKLIHQKSSTLRRDKPNPKDDQRKSDFSSKLFKKHLLIYLLLMSLFFELFNIIDD